MKLFILFVVMNVINVVIQTVKSIATIKCGKTAAAIVNALAYGLYTYIVVLTMCDLPLLAKCLVVAAANFVGVWVVKWFEEKSRKDRLWKIEATITNQGIESEYDDCLIELKENNISCNYIDIEKYIIVNCFCETQKESSKAKEILQKYNAKYFVSESKTL
jgi:uncharacterized protein YebE (UPF0316 family)